MADGNACLCPTEAAPNIIFILADDLGYGDTGVTGQNARATQGLPAFATPNIDALAQAGVRFNNMYSGGEICSPARASLLTGFHQGHLVADRVDDIKIRGGNEDRTWGQVLQDAGYETGMFGKWHLGGVPLPGSYSSLPTQKGFETVYGGMQQSYRVSTHYESDGAGGMKAVAVPSDPTWTGSGGPYVYGDDLVTNRAEQFIRQRSVAGQPFAAYVALVEPHAPHNEIAPNHPYATGNSWSAAARNYAGLIYNLDRHVGQILQSIEDPNGDGNTSDSVASNTLVVFTSDNGVVWPDGSPGFDPEFFDSNGVYSGWKWTTNEGGIRTPFFVRWTGTIASGTVNNSYVGSFADIMPTLAALTGQESPLGIDGRSMLSDLVGGAPSERRGAMTWLTERGAFANQPANVAVQVGDWKLSIREPVTTPAMPLAPIRLFNTAIDPSETNNLVNSRPDIVAALQAVAVAEAGLSEPTGPSPFVPGQYEMKNTYFTQYKTWTPQAGSTNFFAAANWTGGTQYYLANQPYDATNWNTSPGGNWLTTMANNSGATQVINITSNANVLALELRGTSQMILRVGSGAVFSAQWRCAF